MAVKVDIVKDLNITADKMGSTILAAYRPFVDPVTYDSVYKDLAQSTKDNIVIQKGIMKIRDAGTDRTLALGKLNTAPIESAEAHYRFKLERVAGGKGILDILGVKVIDEFYPTSTTTDWVVNQILEYPSDSGQTEQLTLGAADWIDITKRLTLTTDGYTEKTVIVAKGSTITLTDTYKVTEETVTNEVLEQLVQDFVDSDWQKILLDKLKVGFNFTLSDGTVAYGKLDLYVNLGMSYLKINDSRLTFPGYSTAELIVTPEYATVADLEAKFQDIAVAQRGPQGVKGDDGKNGVLVNYDGSNLIFTGETYDGLYESSDTQIADTIVLQNGTKIKFNSVPTGGNAGQIIVADGSNGYTWGDAADLFDVVPSRAATSNDTTPLFFEHYNPNKLADLCFVESLDQWLPAKGYTTAYNRLVRHLRANDGFKVIAASDTNNVANEGEYFIVDEPNMRFKIPTCGSQGAPKEGIHLYYKLQNSVVDEQLGEMSEVIATLNNKMDAGNIVTSFVNELKQRPEIESRAAVVLEHWHSSTGNNWYRVWSDGCIEQGGTVTVPGASANWGGWATVNLFIPYANTNYVYWVVPYNIQTGANGTCVAYQSKTVSSFQVRSYNIANNTVMPWFTRGWN